MSEWQDYTLGELINVKHGYAFPGEFITPEPTPNILVTPGNFYIGGGFKQDKFKYFRGEIPESYLLKAGDIVVTMTDLSQETDTLGFSAKIPNKNGVKYLHNQRIGLVEFISDDAYKEFIYWLLRTNEYQGFIVGASSGTSIRHTSPKFIKEYKFKLPPPKEQKAIASVLSSLDDKIDLLHRQNTTLERMAETLFRQWFIEEAQEDWIETKIKDFDVLVTDFVANGSFASLKENVTLVNDKKDYALFIRNTDLKSNFSTKVYVTEHSYNFLSKTKLFGGEVIISSVGDVGSVFRCPKFNMPMTLGNNMIMLKSEFSLYFYLFFKSDFGQSLIYGITSGSVQEKFNKSAFRDLILSYPSIQYIKKFEEVVKPWFSKLDLNKSQIDTLEKLRDNLLPKLMSGEVRVAL